MGVLDGVLVLLVVEGRGLGWEGFHLARHQGDWRDFRGRMARLVCRCCLLLRCRGLNLRILDARGKVGCFLAVVDSLPGVNISSTSVRNIFPLNTSTMFVVTSLESISTAYLQAVGEIATLYPADFFSEASSSSWQQTLIAVLEF
jgi:hypothetical protein